MTQFQELNRKVIFNILVFGLIVYLIAIFVVPMIIGIPNVAWTIAISFVPGLLTIYYTVLQKHSSVFKHRIYIASLILGFMFWIGISVANQNSNTFLTIIEIVTPIFVFLLINVAVKR